MSFEYNAPAGSVKLEDGSDFKCGDRTDGYSGYCNAGNFCDRLNTCKPIPHNPKWPITQSVPISYERNYGYRVCRSNLDTQCIITNCKNTCENSQIRIQ
jgi:hypothetical protein